MSSFTVILYYYVCECVLLPESDDDGARVPGADADHGLQGEGWVRGERDECGQCQVQGVHGPESGSSAPAQH